MSFIYQRESVRTTGFVRESFRQRQPGLATFMPNRSVDSNTFEIQSADRTNSSVPFRAYDAPGVRVERTGFDIVSGRLQPITAVDVLSESHRHDIRAAALSGDLSGPVQTYIEDRAAELTRRVSNRIEKARGEVLATGALTLSENGVILTKDYGTAAPVNASVAWATVATADPIADLFARQEAARNAGYELRHAIMSSTAINNLLTNASLIGSVPAGAGVPPQLTPATMAAIVQAHTGLTIHRYDYQVDGARVVAADMVILLPDPDPDSVARTEFGVTAEQMELDIAFSASEPNIVGIIDKHKNPVRVETLVTALAMPVIADPNAVHVLDIAP